MIKEIIKESIASAFKKLEPELVLPNFIVELADNNFGDYATNAALITSKILMRNPREIAEGLVKELVKESLYATVEVAGPGFINFRFSNDFWQTQVSHILEQKNRFGHSDLGKDLKVLIEFISANPTGPLTLGNGRNAYSGDVLANIYKAYGAKVEREYYINDRGVQIVALGHSVLKDDEAVYKGYYIDEIAPMIKSKAPDQAGEEAAAIILEKYIKKTIEKMGVEYDTWFSEKRLHDEGTIAKTMEYLQELGLTYEQEGAIWLKTSQFGDDKDRVLVTSKGEYTYFASDIAYHADKINRGYNLLIDFWGADHHGYIGRMQAAIDMLRQGNNWSGILEIMICQLVRLMSNGQEVRMSKRKGVYVLLDELIDEVGPDVTRFFFLDRSLNTHMDFNLDLAKERSDKNPVYYVQYAYARISSILAKAKDENLNLEKDLGSQPLLREPAEVNLAKQLVRLPELVEEIAVNQEVQKLTFYARDLAMAFHNFYEKCPVLKAESDIMASRINLLKATKIVLKNTFDLIGISSPEKM